jgi:hypothetical protein
MKLIFIILIFFITPITANEKYGYSSEMPKNYIYFGLFGDASITSLSYERLLLFSPNCKLTGKGGVGFNQEFNLFGGSTSLFVTMPHHITGNFGKSRHHLEIGLGGTLIFGKTNEPYLLYPIVGYRIMPLKENKVNFRIYGSFPFSGLETDVIFFIPIGLSIGINL